MIKIHGNERVEGVTVAKVGSDFRPIAGTEWDIQCDTLLLSVGLIPENELTLDAGGEADPVTNGPVVDDEMRTSIPGVFACGNVVHIHDLVDNVTREAWAAGEGARFVAGQQPSGHVIPTAAGEGSAMWCHRRCMQRTWPRGRGLHAGQGACGVGSRRGRARRRSGVQ